MVNNASVLVNDSDIKLDYDPTQHSAIIDAYGYNIDCDMTYSQAFCETQRFINDNNSADRPYLQYPKLFLQCNNVKCDDELHCKECGKCSTKENKKTYTNTSKRSLFGLCLTKRREIADKLYDCAREQNCITDSLTTTAAKLFISSESLIKDSSNYTLNSHWFAKLYSFLKWNQEGVNVLLHNLVYLDMKSMSGQKKQENGYNEVEQSIFLFKFDFLTSLHSYLDKLIEYLVLYYCCVDTQSWIAIFYPFIEIGVGTYNCGMLFAESSRYSNSKQIASICNEALKMNINETAPIKDEMDKKENILKEMKALSIFQRLLFDTICDIYSDNSDTKNNYNYNIVNYVLLIKSKLHEMVDNIKSQNTSLQLQISDAYEIESSNEHQMDMPKKLHLYDLTHKNISNMFKNLMKNTGSYVFEWESQKIIMSRVGVVDLATFKKRWKYKNSITTTSTTDSDIYYHYFNKNELKQVLKSILMNKYGFIGDLVDLVCVYCGCTRWLQLENRNENEKTPQAGASINVYNSNDGMISYAICHRNDTRTIFLNTHIDPDVKSIYRFLFKNVFINANSDDQSSYIRVGMMGKDCEKNIDLEDGDYIGVNDESLCWSYFWGTSGECAFIYDDELTQRIQVDMTDGQSINSYFLIEIDLKQHQFRVYLPVFGNDQKECNNGDDNHGKQDIQYMTMECDIPQKVVNQDYLRIGVTIENLHKQYKHIGVGLVRKSM